jgi:hypothetical protein
MVGALSAIAKKLNACGCTRTRPHTLQIEIYGSCVRTFGLEKCENCPQAQMTNALLRCNDKHTASAECITVCAGYESVDSHYIHACEERLRVRSNMHLCKDVSNDNK